MLDTRLCIRTSRDLFVTHLLRSVFGTAGMTMNRCNTLICLCHRYHRSRQFGMIRPQLPRNSNTRCAEYAIPSLVLQQSRISRSPLHTIWREKDRGTRSLVMSHVDTAQHPLVSASHCIVISPTSLKCTDSPNSTTGRCQVFPQRR